MKQHVLYLFTRTPLHVGSGNSVGAIDQPIQRERHTSLPIIPASSLKGSFADQWPVELRNSEGISVRLTSKKGDSKHVIDQIDGSGSAWLFGSDDAHVSFAGSLLFGEARLLAFPIRSARGSHGWVTCPLMLQRAVRDGALPPVTIPTEPRDNEAIFKSDGPLALGQGGRQIVLEEYAFSAGSPLYPMEVAKALASLVGDALLQSITERLVILSNGMMSQFATTACDVAQHVRISDETGTADPGGLFNQENVPADTLFYAMVGATRSRVTEGVWKDKSASDALSAFLSKIEKTGVFQFGADASTGLGYCTVNHGPKTEQSNP